MLSWLTDRFLRVDARSLGLFRIAFGSTLLCDLLHRWDWLRAFYSNDGVVPNHFHLFQHKGKASVWSVYHAFSSVDENTFAFLITLFIYLCFILGWHTRIFHALTLLCLVSLVGRNVLLDSPASSVAISLLAVSLLLPLGARFSIDSLTRSMAARDEHRVDELNDRQEELPRAPASLAGLGLLLLLGLIYLSAALQQNGETWVDGSALYYALHVDRWTGAVGVSLRESLSPAILAGWTRALHFCQLAIPVLIFIPVARRISRSVGAMLMLFHGLTIGVLFNYGLYGWSLLAAIALLIPKESWDAIKKQQRPVQLLYDDDCGMCLSFVRLIKRLDRRHNVTFVATTDTSELPEGVTAEMVENSAIAIDANGRIYSEARAIAEVMRSIPVLGFCSYVLRIPGISHIAARAYRRIARNRLKISEACGLGVCGIERSESLAEQEDVADVEASPAQRWGRRGGTLALNLLAVILLSAIFVQTARANQLDQLQRFAEPSPVKDKLARVATASRMMANWAIWAPDPPKVNGALVIEAETRNGWKVDLLTGYPPDMQRKEPRRARLGHLWAAYSDRIQEDEWSAYRKELRRYLSRGGDAVNTKIRGNYIAKLKVHWASSPIPPPGSATESTVELVNLLNKRATPRRNQSLPRKIAPRLR